MDFIPLFFDELTNVTDAQKMVCEDNQQCLFDLAVTGDMAFAMNTLNHQKDANATKDVLGLSISLMSYSKALPNTIFLLKIRHL